MVRRIAPPLLDETPDEGEAGIDGPVPAPDAVIGGPDLAVLGIAGLNQRKVAAILGALVAAWIIVLFARQVGDAAAASARADAMIADNASRHTQVAALEWELARIQQSRFVLLQARAHGLGGHNEIAFTLDPGAPPLPSDAPGSAGQRIGATAPISPLDRWLTLLVGSGG
ncbi:MAG: hypothetical protein QOJ75_667 [Chloroflexota bacterium]|jgi:hypothetical protein|nr:hypothetical protein [Chloroflexota bacterium]